jgi:hypothetical protein
MRPGKRRTLLTDLEARLHVGLVALGHPVVEMIRKGRREGHDLPKQRRRLANRSNSEVRSRDQNVLCQRREPPRLTVSIHHNPVQIWPFAAADSFAVRIKPFAFWKFVQDNAFRERRSTRFVVDKFGTEQV